MNSHDLAAQLDSHLNNSILINDEVLDHENNHNNIINNNVIPMGIFPNELHILNINALNQPDSINNLPNHPAQQNYHIIQNAENNPVFNFDSDDNNDEEINNYSFEFHEVITINVL